MAGYHGFSMSNNAVEAYDRGEMPMSKWTKRDIIRGLRKLDDFSDEQMEWLEHQSAGWLKCNCLAYTGYHHTGTKYRKTNFYEVCYSPEELEREKEYRELRDKKQAFLAKVKDQVIEMTDITGEKHEHCEVVNDEYFVDLDKQNYRVWTYSHFMKRLWKKYPSMEKILLHEIEVSESGNIYARGRKPTRAFYKDPTFYKDTDMRVNTDTWIEKWENGKWVRLEKIDELGYEFIRYGVGKTLIRYEIKDYFDKI